MKNKLIKIMVGSIFASSTAMVFASGGIPYQNMNEQGGNVNSIPSSTPQMQQNNPYEKNYGANAGVNTTETMNEQGQRVIRTEEVQKLDQSTVQQNPARNYAAQSMTEKFWNMPNSQIRDIKNKFDSKNTAISQDTNPAKCVQSTVNITNEPGANLPLIRLNGKNIATVLVTDVFGNPWSIDYITNGNDVNVIRDSEDPEVSTFHVQTKNNYGQGNLAVKLSGNPVPIVFSFVNGQKEVDCLMVAKLSKAGPNANVKTQSLSQSAMDSSLNSTLYGVAPKDAKQLKVSTNDATAWLTSDGKVILRTKYELLSPAYESVTRSPDGTFVYKSQYLPIFTYRYNDLISEFQVTK